jgi:hypothetical protein
MELIREGDTFAPLLPRETYEQLYQSGPDVTFAGLPSRLGTADAAAGGWRINGRWPFASGCQHAEWMAGFCSEDICNKAVSGGAQAQHLHCKAIKEKSHVRLASVRNPAYRIDLLTGGR